MIQKGCRFIPVFSALMALAIILLWVTPKGESAPLADETDLPTLDKLDLFQPGEPAILLSDNGRPFAAFANEYRIFVPFHKIPVSLRNAVLAIEDARFYEHGPVDVKGIARAAIRNLTSLRIKEGGSTITQQLAKILFLTPERTLARKLKELKLARELESRYHKDKILEMYLNLVYLGHGAYGVEAAARTYFSKLVTRLTLPEAALIAGLIRAPALYSPFLHPKKAKERRDVVLQRMMELKLIPPAEGRAAMKTPIKVIPYFQASGLAPTLVDYVRQELERRYTPQVLLKGGLRVSTTLNLEMQRAAVLALKTGLQQIKAGLKGSSHPALEGAIVAMDPRTGAITAMVGGSDYSRSQFNRAVQMRRQPGSAFKPFVYAAAFDLGFTPADLLLDEPVRYPISSGTQRGVWTPENFDRTFRGAVTLRRALEESINVPTVRLIEQVGVNPVIRLARQMGIRSELRREFALALGTSEVNLLELTAAYGTFASRGIWARPTSILEVSGPNGELLEESAPERVEVLREEVAYLVTSVLQGAVQRGTAKRAKALGRPVAAKTGTSQEAQDLWFIGYTPSLVAGLWIGYDTPQPLGSHQSAGRLAAPIWVAFMKAALKGTPPEEFLMPPGVLTAWVNRNTGQPSSPEDPEAIPEVFIQPSTAPTEGPPPEPAEMAPAPMAP
ncbi:MAG: penicillin-binding protein 1A [candidate division NC10 bacterium]|nr:penicillin-binding protein 1A [candidate division NC10 bacterium]